VSALYENGSLVRLATRGDGETGEDITAKAPLIAGLPTTVNIVEKIELRGEIYMTDADFAFTNEARVSSGADAFLNPRNATAGIIRALELAYEPRLSFACYDLAGPIEQEEFDSYRDSLTWLSANGVPSAFSLTPAYPAEASAEEILSAIENERANLGFPIDGAVIKVNDRARREELGYVGKAPKWATAFKYAADTATTVLRDIEVALGRTGQMSLRAVLEPVHVAGTTITYATLHNPKFIADADIRIGDTVYVYRAGDVVPRVDKVDISQRPDGTEAWQPPTECVNCGQQWNMSTQLWRCDNPECSFTDRVIYALSRSALDIDGASEAIADALVSSELVTSIPDIFTLTEDQLSTLELEGGRVVGQKVGKKIFAEIQKAKTLPNYKFLVSLGLRTLGRTLSKRIMATYPTLNDVAGLGVTELQTIEGIGSEKAEIIASEIANNQPVIQAYIKLGLGIAVPSDEASASGTNQPLAGEVVVVSGTVPGYTRDTARELVEQLGGTSASSVTSRTTILVAGSGAGSKVEKAESLGIRVWTPEQLLELT
jgi:DNA ligase (NAD+)